MEGGVKCGQTCHKGKTPTLKQASVRLNRLLVNALCDHGSFDLCGCIGSGGSPPGIASLFGATLAQHRFVSVFFLVEILWGSGGDAPGGSPRQRRDETFPYIP